jgi:hypothetical protein
MYTEMYTNGATSKYFHLFLLDCFRTVCIFHATHICLYFSVSSFIFKPCIFNEFLELNFYRQNKKFLGYEFSIYKPFCYMPLREYLNAQKAFKERIQFSTVIVIFFKQLKYTKYHKFLLDSQNYPPLYEKKLYCSLDM